MDIQNIIIIYNKSKDGAVELVNQMVSYFSDKNVTYLEVNEVKESNLKADIAFSIGGDGTALTCCRALCSDQKTPIIAINLGTFGYITEVEASQWKTVYQDFISGKLELSKRRLLSAFIKKKDTDHFVLFSQALNDIVVASSQMAKVVKLGLNINSNFGGEIKSDGVIVASPTGSTAYSLAAGGPIVEPELDALIINPICPFTLSNRPIVVSAKSEIELEVLTNQRTSIILNADGQVVCPLEEGDTVRILSSNYAYLVKAQNRSFIEILKDKLRWDGGTHA